MSWQATAWAISQVTGDPARKMVLMALADRHHPDTGECFPSHERIAIDAEMHESTVRRHLRALEEMGIIRRQRRHDARGYRTSDGYEFVGFEFRPSPSRGEEKPATQGRAAPERARTKRANRALGEAETKRADCALGEGPEGPPNVQPNEHCCAVYIEPTSLEPNPSIESQSSEPCAREEQALAKLRGEIGLAAFNAWFSETSLTLPDDPARAALLVCPRYLAASYIRQHFGARLELLLGRRIEYAAREGPASGVTAHGVRVIGEGEAERAAT